MTHYGINLAILMPVWVLEDGVRDWRLIWTNYPTSVSNDNITSICKQVWAVPRKMSPSLTETVSHNVDQKQEQLSSLSMGQSKNEDLKVSHDEIPAPAVQKPLTENEHIAPLKLSGALDHFESFDVTPIIGREFIGVNLAKWLRAPNSDELLRDLAITSMRLHPVSESNWHIAVSQRGVVFFRRQDDITDELQKELVQRLGELSGKPATSKLHIHPISNSARELGGKDDEISVISSEQAKKIYKDNSFFQSDKKQSGKEGWHSDITFETIPSDYALLRLTQLPKPAG
jgi:hypothetical protein